MSEIPPGHPRAASLKIRERLIEYHRRGVVATAGLIAHGRGEAFDYLLGEETQPFAIRAVRAAAAALLLARHPVLSVNGNVAALVADDVVRLAEEVPAKIEVNLFYRTPERELAVKDVLEKAGAREVLGVGEAASATIPELFSERRRVDPRGIAIADVVLVPLEDGDRTQALRRLGKTVIAIDLNPLSRTSLSASITIVDNVIRAMPNLVKWVRRLKARPRKRLERIVESFDNDRNLAEAIRFITQRLSEIARAIKIDTSRCQS